ncbi:MAG: hypothetical protein J7540_21035 [Roseofilum sp. SID2]|uniref:hypothetical protein n=1 Tax=unclassified Roseofilum TaxID=2620099 RepID=UPI001B1AC2C0|nr:MULTISPECIES: hypothetical protein [unclassified Roseofilum]MBP0013147.1 hypothetical protein [Roseofilum sp. SID3]MBP0026457.1 hypothetical protein [Roseofilum sp. SID2]MBP0037835.1 hypothetical protein [Roseofilum sp. SID1]
MSLSEKWVENPVLKGRLCGTIKLVTDPPATMETESLTSKIAFIRNGAEKSVDREKRMGQWAVQPLNQQSTSRFFF